LNKVSVPPPLGIDVVAVTVYALPLLTGEPGTAVNHTVTAQTGKVIADATTRMSQNLFFMGAAFIS
jgi:hypothetical protein